jgi:Cof subfamily protein (haloacid dehalogenase superfamily)
MRSRGVQYRLLALDLDGTLLDPFGRLTDSVREAVAAARRQGLRVVLCTGRRFRTALPLARELGLEGEIVVHNGAVVKDLGSGKTLDHRYLESGVARAVVGLLREVATPLVYVDTYHEEIDFLTERLEAAHPFQLEYLEDMTEHCRVVADVAAEPREDVIMVSTMGESEALGRLRGRVLEALGSRVHTNSLVNKNYRGHILEFLAPGSSKWSALERIARAAGIAPAQIAAVGDDHNDAEMIRRAGLGIAMGNAVREVLESADLVVAGNAEGGAARAIERVLLAG